MRERSSGIFREFVKAENTAGRIAREGAGSHSTPSRPYGPERREWRGNGNGA